MKTVIIGNAGSGKTWLAKRIATLSIDVIHLDNFFWMPDGFNKKRSEEKINSLVKQSKESPEWIVEGVFGELAELYLDIATTLIWLDIPWELCRLRLNKRALENNKKHARTQSKEGLKKLIKWASEYYDRIDFRSYIGHQKLFNNFNGIKIHIQSEQKANEYVKKSQ